MWYLGKVTQVITYEGDGSFTVYMDDASIQSICESGRVRVEVSNLGIERTKAAFSMALTALTTGKTYEVVLDLPTTAAPFAKCRLPVGRISASCSPTSKMAIDETDPCLRTPSYYGTPSGSASASRLSLASWRSDHSAPGNCGQFSINALVCTCVTLLALIATSDSCLAAGERPAAFRHGSAALENRIKYPKELPVGIHVLFCSGRVDYRGYLHDVTCYQLRNADKHLDHAIRSIAQSAENYRLSPAYKNGYPRWVWIDFSLVFVKASGKQVVKVLPNHLLSLKKYGIDYTSPQRLYVGHLFPRCGRKTLMMGRITVGVNGIGDDPHVVFSKERKSRLCYGDLRRTLKESLYIPATSGGKFVPAPYEEIFYTPNVVH